MDNSFLTLTYSDDFLPSDWSLNHDDFQRFMKRLRKSLSPAKIRYMMCGEYGDRDTELYNESLHNKIIPHEKNVGRPHYHVCLFGYQFPDLIPAGQNNGVIFYDSEILTRLWGLGRVAVGHLTFESAAYTARYITKKITGDIATDHYTRTDLITGETNQLLPEYLQASRRPGIGHGWFKKYSDDLKKDYIVIRGVKMKPAKYYDRLFEQLDPEFYEQNKSAREITALETFEHCDTLRLTVKEGIKKRKLNQLTRTQL